MNKEWKKSLEITTEDAYRLGESVLSMSIVSKSVVAKYRIIASNIRSIIEEGCDELPVAELETIQTWADRMADSLMAVVEFDQSATDISESLREIVEGYNE